MEIGAHGRWRPTGETILYAVVACLFAGLVLGSLDPTGQLRGSFLGTVQGPGVTLDEGFNVDVGTRLADSVLTGDLVEYARRTGELPDHPPLGRLWLGLAHEVALLGVSVGRVESNYVVGLARTGSAVAFGLTLFLIGRIASQLAHDADDADSPSRIRPAWVGLVAMLAYGTLPRQFAHAHIASLESCVALSWAAVLAWLVSRDGELSQPRTAIGMGVWLGLAWLVKVQGILLVPPLIVWYVLRCGRRGVWLVAIALCAAAVVFFVGWPWLWSDPIGRTLAYLGRTTQRSPTLVWYGGVVYEDHSVPWHYPWTTFAVSQPILTLALQLVGLTVALVQMVRLVQECGWTQALSRNARTVGLIAVAAGPLLLFSLPGVAVYDGERLFSMVYVVSAVWAGGGVAVIARWCGEQTANPKRGVALAMAFIATCMAMGGGLGIVATWPCSFSYYSSLVGGPHGAVERGWARTYWSDSLCRELLEQVPQHVPAGSTIEILPVMHPFQIPVLGSQTPALLDREYRLIPYNTPRPAGRRFLLVFFRDDYLEPPFRQAIPPGKPLAELRRSGVLLGGLYELPEPEKTAADAR